jgi:eukaryotic-like serine/threonine-protein kinase
LPPNSLAHVDACSLADESALARIPGLDPMTADRRIGGWRCDWGGEYHALVLFEHSEPFAPEDGDILRIRGREAQVDAEGYIDDGCALRVAHRPFTDFRGDPAMEVVLVDVGGTPSPEQNCALAQGLADAVTAKLPPA